MPYRAMCQILNFRLIRGRDREWEPRARSEHDVPGSILNSRDEILLGPIPSSKKPNAFSDQNTFFQENGAK